MSAKPPLHPTDIFIPGFMKSGTTALAGYLNLHPDISVSTPKEPGYFASDLMQESDRFHGRKLYFQTRTPQQYEDIFDPSAKLRVDASTAYIYSNCAAEAIYQHNPKAKIIICIRDPVSFLISLHQQYLNETVETEADLAIAWRLEEDRKAGRYIPSRVRVPSYLFYRERLKYFKQIRRFLDTFPKDQIKLLLFDDFLADNQKEIAKIMEFIGLDMTENWPPRIESNSRRVPRNASLHRFINSPTLKRTLYRVMGGRLYTRTHKSLQGLMYQRRPSPNRVCLEFKEEVWRTCFDDVEQISKVIQRDLKILWGCPTKVYELQ